MLKLRFTVDKPMYVVMHPRLLMLFGLQFTFQARASNKGIAFAGATCNIRVNGGRPREAMWVRYHGIVGVRLAVEGVFDTWRFLEEITVGMEPLVEDALYQLCMRAREEWPGTY